METVTVRIYGHGEHTVPAYEVDRAIARYLPASPNGLREIVEERTGENWNHVLDVSVFLVVLADFDRTDGQ